MAEPVGMASGILALTVFALKPSSKLVNEIQSFHTLPRQVRELLTELSGLTVVLRKLSETGDLDLDRSGGATDDVRLPSMVERRLGQKSIHQENTATTRETASQGRKGDERRLQGDVIPSTGRRNAPPSRRTANLETQPGHDWENGFRGRSPRVKHRTEEENEPQGNYQTEITAKTLPRWQTARKGRALCRSALTGAESTAASGQQQSARRPVRLRVQTWGQTRHRRSTPGSSKASYWPFGWPRRTEQKATSKEAPHLHRQQSSDPIIGQTKRQIRSIPAQGHSPEDTGTQQPRTPDGNPVDSSTHRIQGNEDADRAAKEATGWREDGQTGPTAEQPRELYSLLSTLKTWTHKEASKAWQRKWTSETRGRTSFRYTPKPTKILQLHDRLINRQSAILVQMRTEKIGLRKFLFSRRVPDIMGDICPCREGRQTVSHVLLRCRRFRHLRRRELGSIPGRNDLRALLNKRTASDSWNNRDPWAIQDRAPSETKLSTGGRLRSTRNPTPSAKAQDNQQADGESVASTKKPTKNAKRTAPAGGEDGLDTGRKSSTYGDALLEMMQRLMEQVAELKRESKEQQATIQELQHQHQGSQQQSEAVVQELQRLLLESQQQNKEAQRQNHAGGPS
ncbi:uncharacterized protein VDAG_02428 [Verticillium dahliae VdLs.17]|uniref:Azaphilone pigments biosynthesis cluster protein L N-terminal domain-containing protein n=1 Tax=Verticillium dahliae (strain VdLs.17 / ATCC MYA-4575 / FGSC 10137) TaxID=498257 RepID=G2WXU6_VERDV|nr:uncharacterized protein VDAG_02428 [Verticillium dahliae VdLs.17]EGY20904.1 hypothetical protein VDAG_02428 [Verticillium dahliae VdLs.17]